MDTGSRIFKMGRITGQIDILQALTQLPECTSYVKELIDAEINEHNAYLKGLYDTADEETQLLYRSEYKQQVPHTEVQQ